MRKILIFSYFCRLTSLWHKLKWLPFNVLAFFSTAFRASWNYWRGKWWCSSAMICAQFWFNCFIACTMNFGHVNRVPLTYEPANLFREAIWSDMIPLCTFPGQLFIADTNNNIIRYLDLNKEGAELLTLELKGVRPPLPKSRTLKRLRSRSSSDTLTVKVDGISSSEGILGLKISLPEGCHFSKVLAHSLRYTRPWTA